MMINLDFFESTPLFLPFQQKAEAAVRKVLYTKDKGFWRAALDHKALKEAEQRAQTIRQQSEKFIVVGIGGSSLGARALLHVAPPHKVYFLESTEPIFFEKLLAELGPLAKTHWIWISKSGSTLETLTHWSLVNKLFCAANLSLAAQSTIVAEKRSAPLQQWAEQNSVLHLEIPSDVSGRFSVLTAVGFLPAFLAGVSQNSFENLDKLAQFPQPVVDLISALLYSWQQNCWSTILWAYPESLRLYAQWWQQLWAESLTKKITLLQQPAPSVSFPSVCNGVQDQHSLLQNFLEGPRDKFILFLRDGSVKRKGLTIDTTIHAEFDYLKNKTNGIIFDAEIEGTLKALRQNKVPVCQWVWPEVTPSQMTVGFLFMEWVVSAIANYLNIDAFNQPGVEQGKVFTKNLLQSS
ncbi:MAG: hypothetical protein K1X29_00550 [Bdellovibrionales bacterium]|nr:hypothetical protein [Bdellovibrionales bacterium]